MLVRAHKPGGCGCPAFVVNLSVVQLDGSSLEEKELETLSVRVPPPHVQDHCNMLSPSIQA